MSLLSIPSELLLVISTFLHEPLPPCRARTHASNSCRNFTHWLSVKPLYSTPHLSAFSRTCRRLHTVLNPVLYATLSRATHSTDALLRLAVLSNNPTLTQVALSHGANIHQTSKHVIRPFGSHSSDSAMTPIQAAAEQGQYDVLKVILAHEPVRKEVMNELLRFARSSGSKETVELLLEAGADEEFMEDVYYTADDMGLSSGVQSEFTRIVTPLKVAIMSGDWKYAKMHLDPVAMERPWERDDPLPYLATVRLRDASVWEAELWDAPVWEIWTCAEEHDGLEEADDGVVENLGSIDDAGLDVGDLREMPVCEVWTGGKDELLQD